MSDLGERLREAREDKDISLEQAEAATHIRGGLLRALEEGRYSELPGDVYGRGLVRNYARYVGLDPAAAVEEFSRYIGRSQQVIPQVLDEPLSPIHRSYGWLVAVLLFVALLVAAWFAYTELYVDRGMRIESLWPLVISTPVVEPGTTPGRATVITPGNGATPEPEQSAEPAGETSEAVVEGEPTLRPTATRISLPTPRPVPSATPTTITGVFVEALATADTYVEATADGIRVYTGILRPNDTARWQAAETIVLRIGNAGGLELLVNGYDVGVLGDSGQVITLEYNVDNLPGQ